MDAARARELAEIRAMTPLQRIALAFELGARCAAVERAGNRVRDA